MYTFSDKHIKMMTMTFSRFIFFVAVETKLADKHDKKLKKKRNWPYATKEGE